MLDGRRGIAQISHGDLARVRSDLEKRAADIDGGGEGGDEPLAPPRHVAAELATLVRTMISPEALERPDARAVAERSCLFLLYIVLYIYVYMNVCVCVRERERETEREKERERESVCVYVCMYVCMYVCICM